MSSTPVTGLPGRCSATLAAWGSAWLCGRVALDEVLGAVGTDEVRWQPDGASERLLDTLGRLRRLGAVRLLLVLPVAGDPEGLNGGDSAGRAAIAAGEAVVSSGAGGPAGPECCLVPAAAGLTGWECAPLAAPESLAAAEGVLRACVRDAAERLSELDVARWRPEVGLVRAVGGIALPPGSSERAQRLLDFAERMSVAVALARTDDGASVNGYEARERDAALRAVAAAARKARIAAVNRALA